MKTIVGLSALVALFCVSNSAAAADGRGLEVGARVGYSFALGSASRANPLSDFVIGAVPIGLDVGYRLHPNFALGAYFQYGFGVLSGRASRSCDASGAECSTSDLRAGLQGSYIIPMDAVEPWIGFTVGYERLSIQQKVSTGLISGEFGSKIVALPDFGLQAGVGFRLASFVSVGPFVSFSMGQYRYGSIDFNGQEAHAHIKDDVRRFHDWFTFGVRGSFTPGR